VQLVGFTIEIYYDARPYERQTNYIITLYEQNVNLVNNKHIGKPDNQYALKG